MELARALNIEKFHLQDGKPIPRKDCLVFGTPTIDLPSDIVWAVRYRHCQEKDLSGVDTDSADLAIVFQDAPFKELSRVVRDLGYVAIKSHATFPDLKAVCVVEDFVVGRIRKLPGIRS